MSDLHFFQIVSLIVEYSLGDRNSHVNLFLVLGYSVRWCDLEFCYFVVFFLRKKLNYNYLKRTIPFFIQIVYWKTTQMCICSTLS